MIIYQNMFFRVESPNGVDIIVKSQGEGIGTDNSGDAVRVFPVEDPNDKGKFSPAVCFESNKQST